MKPGENIFYDFACVQRFGPWEEFVRIRDILKAEGYDIEDLTVKVDQFFSSGEKYRKFLKTGKEEVITSASEEFKVASLELGLTEDFFGRLCQTQQIIKGTLSK